MSTSETRSAKATIVRRIGVSIRNGNWVSLKRLHAYTVIFLVLWSGITGAWIATSDGLIDRDGKIVGTDFLGVWAASSLALEGRPSAIYDWPTHGAVERKVAGSQYQGYYGWHYPPTFLLLAYPLALLPYLWSLGIYLASTFGIYVAIMWSVLRDRAALWAALAFPGAWVNLQHGQNGFLTTGLFGGGLLLLDRRPLLAGILLGLLSYKPQFGLMIPIALIAAGRWRSIVGATVGALAAALVSLLAFGGETWIAFFDSLRLTRQIVIEEGGAGWSKIQSVFSAVRMLGGDVATAYSMQGLAVVAVVTIIFWIWRRGPADLRAAALVVAAPLTTPYVLDYDLVILALPIALMARHGLAQGFAPYEKSLLVIAWLLPLFARVIGSALGVPLTPFVLGALLYLIARRVAATDGENRFVEAHPCA